MEKYIHLTITGRHNWKIKVSHGQFGLLSPKPYSSPITWCCKPSPKLVKLILSFKAALSICLSTSAQYHPSLLTSCQWFSHSIKILTWWNSWFLDIYSFLLIEIWVYWFLGSSPITTSKISVLPVTTYVTPKRWMSNFLVYLEGNLHTLIIPPQT